MKKLDKSRKNLILRICIFAFVCYAAVILIDMQVSITSRKQELAELEQEIESQRLANKDLARQLDQGVDEEYIERIAREKLDFVKPNQRVYVDISGS